MPASTWIQPWRSRQQQRRGRAPASAKSGADSGEGWTCAKARGHQGFQNSTRVLPCGPGRRGQQHVGSVRDMPLRHTTCGVPNHPRPDTRDRTTVPCFSRSSVPAHSPAQAALVHPARPPGLHPLLLALRQGLRPSISQPASDTCSPSAASGVRQAQPARTARRASRTVA
jgi:hypothetical protein